MTDAIAVEELVAQKEELLRIVVRDNKAMQDAQSTYAKSNAEFAEFISKYGRVLQL